MRQYSFLPNLFTQLNAISGFIGIVLASKGELSLAALMVFVGAFFDLFDGYLARLIKVEGDLGKVLDSVADGVTFGVLPSLILFQLLEASHFSSSYLGIIPIIPILISLIPLVAVLYRLAKFSVAKDQNFDFKGIPSPSWGIFIASLPLTMEFDLFMFEGESVYLSKYILNEYFLSAIATAFALLMISNLHFVSFKWRPGGLGKNYIPFSFLVMSIILFILLFFAAIPVLILVYILISVFHKTEEDEIQSQH